MVDRSPSGQVLRDIAGTLEPVPALLATIEAQVERLDVRVGKIAAAVTPPGQHKTEQTVTMPTEPAVVLSDGEVFVVVTDRTCEPVHTWGRAVGPVARTTMAARLRATAALIEGIDHG